MNLTVDAAGAAGKNVVRDLGATFRPIETTLAAAVSWFEQNGYLPAPSLGELETRVVEHRPNAGTRA